jgi:hypothetical protein
MGGTNSPDAEPPLVDSGAPDFGAPPPDASLCAGPAPAKMFAVSSGNDVSVGGAFVVLSGTLPSDIGGSPIAAVEVGGSARGVRFDAARGVWSYLLAASASGSLSVTARAMSGATAGPLTVRVTVPAAPVAPARDIVAGQRTVGSWMFTWFTGDTSWRCTSPWQPPAGFASWNGTPAWARDQLIDQIDAHLDAIGLQLDTPSGAGAQGFRFTNVVNVMVAARGLLEEGVLPPRLFPFIDTAIIADHWLQAQGSTLDISTTAGRTYLYGHPQAYYQAAAMALGPVFGPAGTARFDGHPAIGFWHSDTINGEDNAAVLDLKARFHTDFGTDPYFIAHPNEWRNFPAVDEITLMVGPPMHYYMGGRDPTGAPTINVEAGFWNPTSNTFYLPRVGGSNYDAAWVSAQGQRATARHVWIDTWNETGEGSGIFAAQPVTYTAADKGPCGQFVNLHDESWATDSRHYINVTRTQAMAWNDVSDLDASPIAGDAPTTMRAGERRYLTVAMQNVGDRTWAANGPLLALAAAARAEGFYIDAPAAPLGDAIATRLGGVARGLPGVFTVLVTAPCTPGAHTLSMQMNDPAAGPFGKVYSASVTVTP